MASGSASAGQASPGELLSMRLNTRHSNDFFICYHYTTSFDVIYILRFQRQILNEISGFFIYIVLKKLWEMVAEKQYVIVKYNY